MTRVREAAYKFVKYKDPENEHSCGKVILTAEDHDLSLPELLLVFEDFLRAVGFSVEMGTLRIEEKDK